MTEIDGKVFEEEIEREKVEEYNAKYLVSGLMSLGEKAKVRYISDKQINNEAKSVKANLEDYYLYVEKQK